MCLAMWLLRDKIGAPAWSLAGPIAIWISCVGLFYYALQKARPPLLLGVCVGGILLGFCWGQTFIIDANDASDVRFIRQVESQVPLGCPLWIDASTSRQGKKGELDFFRIAFYLRPTAQLLQNLTFLRAQTIDSPEGFVVARRHDEAYLQQLGQVRVVCSSARTRREISPGDRLALFDLHFKPDLRRYPALPADRISVMQAMGRAPGPFCGPAPDFGPLSRVATQP